MNGQQSPQQQIQIKMDEKVLKGVYANAMGISHSKEEFVLDFLNIYPWQRTGVVTSRVITSPGHIKRIFRALEENLKKYEQKFGKIEEAKAPSTGEIGFKTA